MAVCGNASKWSKIGLILHSVGFVLFLPGFATIGWMASQTTQNNVDIAVGMFKMKDCVTGSCSAEDTSPIYQNGGRDATLGLMCIVMIVSFVATVMYCIYIASDNARSKCFAITIMCITFSSSLLLLIGIIIYIVLLPQNFYASYSMGLIAVAGGLFVTAGCLLVPDIRNNVYAKAKSRITPPPPVLPPVESPIDRYLRDPEPEFYSPTPKPSPRPKKGYWEYKEYESPRVREPRSPRSPEVVRVHLRSTTPSSVVSHTRISVASNASSTRRYGTPKFSQRYDNRAR